MKNWGWSTTTTGISIRTTEGGSAAIPSRKKVVGICSRLLKINPTSALMEWALMKLLLVEGVIQIWEE